MADRLKVVFMGTPAYAVPTLEAVAATHDVVAAYSQPPRAAGRRGLKLTPSPVHAKAEALGIEVRTPTSLKSEEEQSAFAALEADIAVVVAYGLILPRPILDAPARARAGYGCLNGHASLLPRWRGAAPIQRAIMAGDERTGVCIMGMEAGLDTGPVALRREVAITHATTAGELHDTLANLTAELMVEALATPNLAFTPQPEDGVTYAAKIEKSETRLTWLRPATDLARHVNGLAPYPGAWFDHDGQRVKILQAEPATGEGKPGYITGNGTIATTQEALKPLRIHRAGAKPFDEAQTAQFLRSLAGTTLA